MKITQKQALHIAIYLYKGVTDRMIKDASIPIGKDAVVGFSKHGKKCHIYIKVEKKYDATAHGVTFPLPVEENAFGDVVDFVQEAIENSEMLRNIDLDMSKVPNPSIDFMKDHPELEMADMDSVDMDSDPLPMQEDDLQEEGWPENEEVTSNDADRSTETAEHNEIEEEFDKLVANSTSNIQDNDLEEIDSSLEEEFEALDKGVDKRNTSSEKKVFSDSEGEKTAMNYSSTELRRYDKKHDEATSLQRIEQESYIHSVMSSGFDFSGEASRLFNKLVNVNPSKATDIYINLVCHLMPEYDYDAVKMSQDVDVDRRNIMLAMMEKQYN